MYKVKCKLQYFRKFILGYGEEFFGNGMGVVSAAYGKMTGFCLKNSLYAPPPPHLLLHYA
jgi:hypothetical protein